MDIHLPMEQRRYKYSKETLMPYLYFFKYMAKKPIDYDFDEDDRSKSQRLKLWVIYIFIFFVKLPDTIVINDRDLPPMWFYSSADGYVYRSDKF